MASAYLTYDTRTGQIISMHHGPVDEAHVRTRATQHIDIQAEHIGVITVPADAFEQGKQYKVDVNRKIPVETGAGEGGVGFSVGGTRELS